ncbi:unnamed protein product, partial [Ectocarpus sp. 4 AP-2014]
AAAWSTLQQAGLMGNLGGGGRWAGCGRKRATAGHTVSRTLRHLSPAVVDGYASAVFAGLQWRIWVSPCREGDSRRTDHTHRSNLPLRRLWLKRQRPRRSYLRQGGVQRAGINRRGYDRSG